MRLQSLKKGKVLDLPITDQQWAAYNTGKSSVEKCFPHLSPKEQKFIKNGVKKTEHSNLLASN